MHVKKQNLSLLKFLGGTGFDTAGGSTNEVENMIDIGYELGFIKKEDYDVINDSLEKTRKLLIGLIKSLEDQKENDKTK